MHVVGGNALEGQNILVKSPKGARILSQHCPSALVVMRLLLRTYYHYCSTAIVIVLLSDGILLALKSIFTMNHLKVFMYVKNYQNFKLILFS